MGLPRDLVEFRALAGRRLRDYPHTTLGDLPGRRRAAVVLCAVRDDQGRPALVVIKRAYQGRNAGQWGLPGGRLDPGETPEQAALRELHEEIGLLATPDGVLGRLDDFPAASGFAITPVVAAPANPGPLRPSPAEIHSVHLVSLERLAADDTPRWVPQYDPSDAYDDPSLTTVDHVHDPSHHPTADPSGDRGDASHPTGHPSNAVGGASHRTAGPSHAVGDASGVLSDTSGALGGSGLLQMRLSDEMVIHPPTGAMLWQFREVVLLGSDPAKARVAHFLQPDWTHR